MRKITILISSVFLVGILSACSDNNNTNSSQKNTNVEQNKANDNHNQLNDKNNMNEENNAKSENNNATHENSENKEEHSDAVDDNEDAKERMVQLNIAAIEVEVEYANNEEYEAEIEHKSDDTYTAEIENDLSNEYIKGQAAFDKLYPLVEKLNIDESSSKEDVVSQVIEAFDLEDNYEKTGVEITFHDSDTELEFEDE